MENIAIILAKVLLNQVLIGVIIGFLAQYSKKAFWFLMGVGFTLLGLYTLAIMIEPAQTATIAEQNAKPVILTMLELITSFLSVMLGMMLGDMAKKYEERKKDWREQQW